VIYFLNLRDFVKEITGLVVVDVIFKTKTGNQKMIACFFKVKELFI
jgi:hypothetical protein